MTTVSESSTNLTPSHSSTITRRKWLHGYATCDAFIIASGEVTPKKPGEQGDIELNLSINLGSKPTEIFEFATNREAARTYQLRLRQLWRELQLLDRWLDYAIAQAFEEYE